MNDHKSLTSQNGKDTEGVTGQSPGLSYEAPSRPVFRSDIGLIVTKTEKHEKRQG